jgi:hypothetical protein
MNTAGGCDKFRTELKDGLSHSRIVLVLEEPERMLDQLALVVDSAKLAQARLYSQRRGSDPTISGETRYASRTYGHM